MAKDILSEYGKDSGEKQSGRAGCGGDMTGRTKDVHAYSAPVGPKSIGDSKTPGLHGENYGNAPTQGKH